MAHPNAVLLSVERVLEIDYFRFREFGTLVGGGRRTFFKLSEDEVVRGDGLHLVLRQDCPPVLELLHF